MRFWKLITHILLTVLLSIGASGVVNAKVASGDQNLSWTLHQADGAFNWLTHQGKSARSTTGPPGSPVATKSATYRGGAYGKLDRVEGLERHHMPADSVSPISRHKGPAIQMDKADHALTSSFGSSSAAKAYRSEIAGMSPRDAMAREIRDIRRIGGTKYNQATREMLDYAKRSGHLSK
jgi:hypothetical protein